MRKKRDEKFITIKDVAKEAGVSIATVSRVINNGIVREEKKKKVLSAIKKLDYIPNDSARNLAAVSQTKNIYLLIPNINSNYYLEFFKGFKSILKTYSYNFSIDFYGYGEQDYLYYLNKNSLSSEFKAFVQIGQRVELNDKSVINWVNENIEFKVSDKYKNMSIYTKDKELEFFLKEKVFPGLKSNDKNANAFLAPTLNEAITLYNEGIIKDIYTFDDATEIQKVCKNIKTINMDFFSIGLALSRIAMKTIRGEEIVKIELTVGE